MNVREIVEKLGGEAQVAALLEVHQTTVQYWIRVNRIPIWHWRTLEKEAHRVGATVTVSLSVTKQD